MTWLGAKEMPCRIPGCPDLRRPSQVMCPRHWADVPRPLQLKIWQLYREARGTVAHVNAIAEAIQAARRAA